ncbi:3258_t:CDS:1, partial [Scutellospora calospora]
TVVDPLNTVSMSDDQKNIKGFNYQSVIDSRTIKRQSGVLENPTKDRPCPPRTRPPSLSPIKLSNTPNFATNGSPPDSISRDSFQNLAPMLSSFSSRQPSPTFNTFNTSDDGDNDNDIHSLSRSPLDRLSDNLLRISQFSIGKSVTIPLNSPENENLPLNNSSLRESSITERSLSSYRSSDSNTIYPSDYNDYNNYEDPQGKSLINNPISMTSEQSSNSFYYSDSNTLTPQHMNSISSSIYLPLNVTDTSDSNVDMQQVVSDQYTIEDDKVEQPSNDVNVRIGFAKQQAAPLYTSDVNYVKPIMIQLGGKASTGSQKLNTSYELP